MKMERRTALAFAATVLWSAAAHAQPAVSANAQPAATIVVPYAPGGGTDVIARLLARKLTDINQRSYVVDNKPGGGTTVGALAVARSRPDGNTLLYATSTTLAINASLFERLSYKPQEDFVPVSLVAKTPMFVVVSSSLGVNSVDELVAYARKNPGKLSFGSAGTGSPHHLIGELIKASTGTFITHIPYRGSNLALNDLLGGVIPMMIAELPVLQAHLQSGKLKVLATASENRVPALPQVPTLAESKEPGLKDAAMTPWHGIVAPAGTPAPVVEALAQQIDQAMNDPAVRQRVAQMGAHTVTNSPAEFKRMIPSETERWAKAVRHAGARAD